MIPSWLENPDPNVYWSDAFELDRVTLDYETDVAVNYGHAVEHENGMLMGVWKWRGQTYVQWGDEFDPGWQRLKQHFDTCLQRWGFIPLVAHNAGYELAWIERMGLASLHDFLCWDTKIGEYVLMGNLAAKNEKTGEAPRSTSLDNCCRRRGWPVKDPIVDLMMKHGINPAEMPRPWLEGRCRLDVVSTDKLFLDQRRRADPINLLPVCLTRNILTPCLTDVTMTGLCLDSERVSSVLTERETEMQRLEIEFEQLTGGVSWSSPPQVSDYLYRVLEFPPEPKLGNKKGEVRKTKGGKLPTDKQALAWCDTQATTEEQRKFVSLRRSLNKVGKSLQALRFFDTVCQERGGIFFGEFNQTKTATHRLASSGRRIVSHTHLDPKGNPRTVTAQLQNLANEFKTLFTARNPGWLVDEKDGSQLEFRVGGFLGNDRQIRADIDDPNFDAHCVSAAEMYELEYETFLAEYRAGDEKRNKQRKSAKPHTFKPFYGGELGTESEMRWYREFGVRYSDLFGKQLDWQNEVADNKMLITPWGLRYYWPRAKTWKRSGKLNVKNQVANYPIQALATAEIIPIALVYTWHSVRGEDRILLTNTVHDSVIAEIEPSFAAEYAEIARDCFTTKVYEYLDTVYGIDFDVPLGLGSCVAEHWTEGPEEAWDVYRDGTVRKVA